MKNLLHIHVNIFVLLLFITSFALSIQHANAQEIGAQTEQKKYRAYQEISVSSGNISYAEPDLWNNADYSSIAIRDINQVNDYVSFFVNLEAAETNGPPSAIDGLVRTSDYQKVGFGYIFNATTQKTTSFMELGVGLIGFQHYIEETDKAGNYRVVYENGIFRNGNTGGYLHVAFGIRINDRLKLSFYAQAVEEGTLEGKGSTSNPVLSDNDANENDKQRPPIPPKKIVNGMAGVRYSLILPSIW
ncbi:MAG: hypothetical protein K0U45_09135 [Alphaproteobacteria bacterium]|nr:hypothetical protein [Alphaproteobacteria bacterium]